MKKVTCATWILHRRTYRNKDALWCVQSYLYPHITSDNPAPMQHHHRSRQVTASHQCTFLWNTLCCGGPCSLHYFTLNFPPHIMTFPITCRHFSPEILCAAGEPSQSVASQTIGAWPVSLSTYTVLIFRQERIFKKLGLQIFWKTFVLTQISSLWTEEVSPIDLKLKYKTA